MAISDLFSKRQRRKRGEVPEVYTYDSLPAPLRVQIVHILKDSLGSPEDDNVVSQRFYIMIHDTLAREFGFFSLNQKRTVHRDEYKAIDFINFFLFIESTESALDCVELSFRLLVSLHADVRLLQSLQPQMTADEAIEELNSRFREHGVGYQFENGEIIRVDSALIHEGATKPALVILRDKRFAAAEQEFLRAYEHYRHGRYEEAITDALKCLESVLKVICAKRRWAYNETDTAKALLNVAFTKELIPSYLQGEFTALRATLESGVPTVRNKQGGHGAGAKPRLLPRHLVSYVLHLTASAVLFLAESDAAK